MLIIKKKTVNEIENLKKVAFVQISQLSVGKCKENNNYKKNRNANEIS